MCTSHNPVQCIVPPHMVERILENGSARQKEKAWSFLRIAGQIRGQRQVLADLTRRLQALEGTRNRLVYSASNESNLPGILRRKEGEGPSGDAAVDEAYDGSGATYDLYAEVFGRNSVDNRGMDLISTVHYLTGYDNAFWNGEQMVYGDGDEDLPLEERLFNRFTTAVDIIGHELTHGVTQHEANLVYRDQAGALNESFSDVFGSLVKQRVLGQRAEEADWLIGQGLFTGAIQGDGIRSMKEPGTAYDDPILGKDPQPGHMDQYVETNQDNGGVHINSGIPNKAFYHLAIDLGGYAWDKAGLIWYKTLCDSLAPNATFQDAANATHAMAGTLYGKGSPEQQAVFRSWERVGILPSRTARPGCFSSLARSFRRLFKKTSA
ncbi:MAG: M4 family metallopeptidase [Bacteroidales bacterium]